MQTAQLFYIASVYGSNDYSADTYNGTERTGTSGGTSTGSSSGGILTNTGFDILLAATLAATIIFVALMIRFWKRPNKVAKTQTSN